MPKCQLIPEETQLERQLIHTLVAGHKSWRPDLNGPESYSDWEACVRAIMRRFNIVERPLDQPLHTPCHICNGLGEFVRMEGDVQHRNRCDTCHGSGKIPFQEVSYVYVCEWKNR